MGHYYKYTERTHFHPVFYEKPGLADSPNHRDTRNSLILVFILLYIYDIKSNDNEKP